eukprot:TRINITY_DN130_c0_g1_i10.p1 TRINITY_DN130_c0_g1~~TRINITY_DN130_c0_g1_i10.p1  ORF type:complete len:205 (-),score=50.83 TRINITY_DN130_c0_g1_i10:714-1328(-)
MTNKTCKKMDRLFGTKKVEGPKPTLDDAGKRVEQRIEGLNSKIRKLDLEAKASYDQMKKMRDGPSKNRVKQKALKALKQKKQYEKQRDQLMQQSFTFDQMKFAAETAKDTVVTVEAMKGANQELQGMYKDLDVGDVEDIYDDMEDMMYMNEEIQDVMSREYGIPDDFDEADLEAELEGLDDELAMYCRKPNCCNQNLRCLHCTI